MDAGKVTAPTFLDLSTAFDTIDHTILLRRLDDWLRTTGNALDWFKSYLTGRCQRIKLGDCLFSEAELPFGVPQGSDLGFLLFTLYITPLSSMICGHAIPHQLCADANCVCPLHQVMLQQWMVYSHVWPLSSHGGRGINCNWTQNCSECFSNISQSFTLHSYIVSAAHAFTIGSAGSAAYLPLS